jgi:sortase A
MLKDIRKGDDIVLETRTGKYLYRVKSMKVVSPKDTEALQPTSNAELNLITCYPFYYVGSAPKRFVVEAQLAGSVAIGVMPHQASTQPRS